MEERLEYAISILPKILDSAAQSLAGDRWWAGVGYTLAMCLEVVGVLAHPGAFAYPSHLPIHKDGSCNGLQYYMALGRDILWVSVLNLVTQERLGDIYSEFADCGEKAR